MIDEDTGVRLLPWFLERLDSAEEAVVSIMLDGTILTWNAAAEQLYGYAADEMLGRSACLLVPPERSAEPKDVMNRLARGERVVRVTTQRRRKEGDLVEVSLQMTPVRDEAGEVVGATLVARDLESLREQYEARRHAQKLEDLGRLTAGVAHDFNNLLTAIVGYGEFALAVTNEDGRESIREMLHASTRAAELTQQLLGSIRRPAKQRELVELDAAVLSLAGLLRRLVGDEVELVFVPPEGPLAPVEIDPTQIEQVVVNLVVNARDAMPGGGRVTVSASVLDLESPSPVPPGRYVALSVADEGMGIDEAIRLRLFEPFFTTKGAGRGTGLGLATVHDIVEQAGGHIEVTSSRGNGAVFTVYLPAAEGKVVQLPALRERTRDPRGTERILVVEDDQQILDMVGKMLEHHGYLVVSACGPYEALELAGERSLGIDLVVADVVLPGMSGPELVSRLGASGRAVPAIFMSAHGGIRHLGLPDDAVLDKPFSSELLLDRVRGALERPASNAA